MVHIMQKDVLENNPLLQILGGAFDSGLNKLVHILADVFQQGFHLFLFFMCECIAIL